MPIPPLGTTIKSTKTHIAERRRSMRCAPFLVALIIFAQGMTAQDVPPSASVVARVGDAFITEREFVERYELLPQWPKRSDAGTDVAKYELMYSLVAEKLLAEEARRRGKDADSSSRTSLEEIRKLLARDALYRNEVMAKVVVDTEDVIQGMNRARRELLIEYIYVESEETANFIFRLVRDSSDFSFLTLDSSMGAIRDTATVIWGDAVPEMEDAAYELPPGAVSRPVKTDEGYYLIRVARSRWSSYFNSISPGELERFVRQTIRKRKEEERAREFVREVLKEKRGYAIPLALRSLSESLARAYDQEKPSSGLLSESIFERALTLLRQHVNDTLAVAGERFWTVGEVLQVLYVKSSQFSSNTPEAIGHAVNEELRTMVQRELLAQEALQRGLGSDPSINEQIKMWSDQHLAEEMKRRLASSVTVSQSEIWAYRRSLDTTIAVPRVRIRELITRSVERMAGAIAELEKGTAFPTAVDRWSEGESAEKNRGITDLFPISERYPVGEIAWSMKVGERFGPVRENGSYVYFELVEKSTPEHWMARGSDSLNAEARNALLRMKQKRKIDIFIAQSAALQGVEIYHERLKALEVSRTPMMTFRFLGFGGRMFAVPFVDRQVDWTRIPAESIPVP